MGDDEVGGDDGEDGPNRDKSKIPFCRNPEEMRAESERKRQEKANRDMKKNARGGPQAAKARQSKDVVGNPKGQGQDKQVLINRARKNTNKNKHQRAAAD